MTADEAWLLRRYGDHPYGREYPTPDQVAEVAPGSLRAAHRRRVVPDGSLLVLVGDLTPARALDQVERALGGWDGPGARDRSAERARRWRPVPLLLVDRPGAVQANLRVGGDRPAASDPSYAGGAGRGRDVRRLVLVAADRQPARGQGLHLQLATAGSGTRAPARRSRVGVEVATDVAAPALVETLYELGRIVTLPPHGRGAVGGGAVPHRHPVLGTATQSGLADTLLDLLVRGLGVKWLRDHPARLAEVTPDQVQQAASTMLAPAATGLRRAR